MDRGAVARGGKENLAGVDLEVIDEVLDRFDRQRGRHHHHVGQLHDAGDRNGVADEIIRQLLVERSADGVVGRDEQQRIAVGPTLSIEPRNTKGSTENIPLLEAGQLDIALSTGEPAYEAFAGIGRPRTNLKILTAMYSSPGMFVVRADSPYKSIRDLRGKPVAFGARGSGLVILSRYVLDGLGLKQDEDFQSVYLDRAGDGPAMVQDGRVAALWGAGIGWPGFTAMAASPGGARFIAPDADEIARIR